MKNRVAHRRAGKAEHCLQERNDKGEDEGNLAEFSDHGWLVLRDARQVKGLGVAGGQSADGPCPFYPEITGILHPAGRVGDPRVNGSELSNLATNQRVQGEHLIVKI